MNFQQKSEGSNRQNTNQTEFEDNTNQSIHFKYLYFQLLKYIQMNSIAKQSLKLIKFQLVNLVQKYFKFYKGSPQRFWLNQIKISVKPLEHYSFYFRMLIKYLIQLKKYLNISILKQHEIEWKQISKIIGQASNLFKILKKVDVFLKTNKITKVATSNCVDLLKTINIKNLQRITQLFFSQMNKVIVQIFELTKEMCNYCDLYLEPSKEISTSDNDITQEIIQIERDIKKKKLSIQKFLNEGDAVINPTMKVVSKIFDKTDFQAIRFKQEKEKKQIKKVKEIKQDQTKLQEQKITTPKYSQTKQLRSGQILKKLLPMKFSPTKRLQTEQLDSSDIMNQHSKSLSQNSKFLVTSSSNYYNEEKNIHKNQNYHSSRKPIINMVSQEQLEEQFKKQFSNMSSEEIKKKIRDYIKEIHGLKSVESDIKWTIEREVKMISRMNEQDQLLDELKWSKEEFDRKEALKKEQRVHEREVRVKDRKFKKELASPKSGRISNLQQIYTLSQSFGSPNEQSVMDSEDQYKSLCCQLANAMRQRDEMKNELEKSVEDINKFYHRTPFKNLIYSPVKKTNYFQANNKTVDLSKYKLK